MAILQYDIDTMAAQLTSGMETALAEAIQRKLAAHAESVVREVAMQMAKNLRGRVRTFRDVGGFTTVELHIDGVKDLPQRLDKETN